LVGKLAALAEHVGYRIIRVEAVGGDDTIRSILRQARTIVEEFAAGAKVARALRSIESVSLTAAGDEDLGVMMALDEAQMLDRNDLRRLLAGVHRCGQDGLPLYCLLAGLPNLVDEVAKAATYAERMFTVADLGPLTPDQVVQAIVEPAEEPISADDVERAKPNARHALDSSFFAARIARIPASEVAYVQALASLGAGPHRSGEVAAAAGKSTPQVAAFRDRLISEGVIYAPRYGWVEFAIPHFDRHVQRSLPRQPE